MILIVVGTGRFTQRSTAKKNEKFEKLERKWFRLLSIPSSSPNDQPLKKYNKKIEKIRKKMILIIVDTQRSTT